MDRLAVKKPHPSEPFYLISTVWTDLIPVDYLHEGWNSSSDLNDSCRALRDGVVRRGT